MTRDHADGGRVLSQGRGACGRGLRPRPPSPAPPARDTHVVWHETECGGYAADLELWVELAEKVDGDVLDLGCGTGRVGLHLARRGHPVTGLDKDARLVRAFNERVEGLEAEAVVGDARDFELGAEFGLVLASMQLVQLFAGAEERVACLRCVERHLRAGGVAAFAIVESVPEAAEGVAPVPDAREVDGWVYSSLPLGVARDEGAIVVRRLRQTVSPQGGLSEEVDEVRLQLLAAEGLEAEAGAAGLAPLDRRPIPATEDHVGSTVVLLGREA